MEATSAKYRALAMFEYAFGWGVGIVFIPVINNLTKDYQLFLAILLGLQLLLLPWLHFGVFESIRWLLSEGKINRAQIELGRACRINGVQMGARLAQDIAQVQVKQVRRASRMFEDQKAPVRLAQALETEVSATARELDMLSAAIKRTFGFDEEVDYPGQETEPTDRGAPSPLPKATLLALSPTLARKSFSLAVEDLNELQQQQQQPVQESNQTNQRPSITTEALIQLAMKYSKQVERQEEGSFFLVRMFHKKLWRQTILLTLFSVMMETLYYGLVQANKFVGSSVDLNYLLGGLSDWCGALAAVLLLVVMSRKGALIVPVIIASLACLGMALSYQLLPDTTTTTSNTVELSTTPNETNEASTLASLDIVELRHTINMYLMNVGKFSVAVGMQIVGTITMESYPSNLRQSAPGAILFVGRVGSILAPFMFSDQTEDNWLLKATLVGVALLGLFCCTLTPFAIRDNKYKDLQDHMDEIE